jgi:hypothetical protein
VPSSDISIYGSSPLPESSPDGNVETEPLSNIDKRKNTYYARQVQ